MREAEPPCQTGNLFLTKYKTDKLGDNGFKNLNFVSFLGLWGGGIC
jgi:hypothetical protein